MKIAKILIIVFSSQALLRKFTYLQSQKTYIIISQVCQNLQNHLIEAYLTENHN